MKLLIGPLARPEGSYGFRLVGGWVTQFSRNWLISKKISIMHPNIHSIQAHIGELISLLNMIDHKFDIIAISESKLCKDPITDINIPSYHEPSITKTEADKGGTMIYVAKGLNFKN